MNVPAIAASYKGKVDVTIITIRDDEYLAVLQGFSDRHAVRGRNIDEVTSVGTRAGVATVAVYRCPSQANSVAQTLATNLLDGLARRSLLAIGIAAGVPSTQYTLGDVIFGMRVVDLSVTPALEGRQPEYNADGWDMLEERLQGGVVLRLIRKWLKTGVLDTDGHVLNPVTGTPQCGVIPPPTIMQTFFLQKDTPQDPMDGIPSL